MRANMFFSIVLATDHIYVIVLVAGCHGVSECVGCIPTVTIFLIVLLIDHYAISLIMLVTDCYDVLVTDRYTISLVALATADRYTISLILWATAVPLFP